MSSAGRISYTQAFRSFISVTEARNSEMRASFGYSFCIRPTFTATQSYAIKIFMRRFDLNHRRTQRQMERYENFTEIEIIRFDASV